MSFRIVISGLNAQDKTAAALDIVRNFTKNATVLQQSPGVCTIEADGFANGVRNVEGIKKKLQPLQWSASLETRYGLASKKGEETRMRVILAGARQPENRDVVLRLAGEFMRNAQVVEDRGAAMCIVEAEGFSGGIKTLSGLNKKLKATGWIAEEPRPRYTA